MDGTSIFWHCRHSYAFHPYSNVHMTPLEIGMYVLLAVFCAAISVFVATCIIYASRAHKGQLNVDDVDVVMPLPPPSSPTIPPLLDHIWNMLHKKKRSHHDNGHYYSYYLIFLFDFV